MLAILDYAAGNQTSVHRAFKHLDINTIITSNKEEILAADGVIFPGVGAAGQAMEYLQSSHLDVILKQVAQSNKPLLGLCLGCQILLDKSQENNTKCLGIIHGESKLFDKNLRDNQEKICIPHMGWNSINIKQNSPLFNNIPANAQFYFVHSYYVEVPKNLTLATTHYGLEFCSIYRENNLFAIQFHPEKSGEAGLQLLKNFNDIAIGRLC